MSREPLPQWRTASPGLRAFWVVVIAVWLVGLSAWIAARAYPADEQVQSVAEAVFLSAWLAIMCLVIGKPIFDRFRR
jgi:hypothetical protein